MQKVEERKMRFDDLREPLEAATAAAIVAQAWPEFLRQHNAGNTTPSSSGKFTIPVGHYVGGNPDDKVLSVEVRLEGRRFDFLVKSSPCTQQLVAKLIHTTMLDLVHVEIGLEAIQIADVRELVSQSRELTFSVSATLTISVV